MNRQEFLNQFNVLYNNETSNQAPDLNGYEISVFLTKAQYEILKNYFSRGNNKSGLGFDDSPKRQIDFNSLIRSKTYDFTSNSKITFNEDIKGALFILNEEVVEDGNTYVVIPISYEEYDRIKAKPYPYPLKRQVWRLFNADALGTDIKLIGHYNKRITSYTIRYIKKPLPIIVEDSSVWDVSQRELLTIGGYPKIKTVFTDEVDPQTDMYITVEELEYPEIELPEELHQEVLQRAVELAKIAWLGDLNATLTGGQRSE